LIDFPKKKKENKKTRERNQETKTMKKKKKGNIEKLFSGILLVPHRNQE